MLNEAPKINFFKNNWDTTRAIVYYTGKPMESWNILKLFHKLEKLVNHKSSYSPNIPRGLFYRWTDRKCGLLLKYSDSMYTYVLGQDTLLP